MKTESSKVTERRLSPDILALIRRRGITRTKVTPLLRHDIGDVLSSCGNNCDKEAQLCIDGQCVCKHGYVDDKGGNCIEDLKGCVHDENAVENLTCRYGYECVKAVYDGPCNYIVVSVFCEPDGMTLVLSNDTTEFEGRIFVRGQVDNPHCSKTFSALEHASKPYMFKVAFEHCNVRLEDDDTFATTVIVQKHPMFITTAADAYDLRCRYPLGVKEVESHVNVSDLTTSSTLTDNTHGPNCRLAITNEANESIAAAVVGQALRLRLEVSPNETYSILPRNCFAINIETGERYSLTDNAGCAIDNQLFPEWTRLNCGLRRPSTTRRFRFRRIRHIGNETEIGEGSNDSDYEEDEARKELFKKLVSSDRLAFSSLVKIRDGEEESRIQEQVDHWKMGSSQQEVLKEPSRVDATLVCVQTAVAFGICIITLICLGALVCTFTRRPLCKANVLFPSTVFSILL
uniref:ZP domain-containing protein n=1 Tax=Angiostrongylus cantonensis TaxID=6313 RepID=A0A0K0D0V8_ANGCA